MQKPRQPISAKADGGSVTIKQPKIDQRHPLRFSRPVVMLAVSTLGNQQNKFSKSSRRNKKPAPAEASACIFLLFSILKLC